MRANDPIGYIEALHAKRDAVLSTARISPAARARIMGATLRYVPVVKVAAKEKYTLPLDLPATNRRIIPAVRYSTRQVLDAVSDAFGIGVRAMLRGGNSPIFTRPRFAAALLLKEHMQMSRPRMANVFGCKSEASGWDMLKRARELLVTDPEWAARYHAAERILKGTAEPTVSGGMQ